MEFARRSIYGLQSCTSVFPLEPVQTDIVEIVDCGLWRDVRSAHSSYRDGAETA